MEVSWADRVKELRRKLGLSQQNFAALLGLTAMSVSRWETGRVLPTELSSLLLNLLSAVIGLHSRKALIEALRRAGPEPESLVRALTWLERHPTIPQLPPTFTASAPPSSNRGAPFR